MSEGSDATNLNSDWPSILAWSPLERVSPLTCSSPSTTNR